jgi:hypothetical protein
VYSQLHEFLQLKHDLKLSGLTMTTTFSSNREYFRRYGGNIFGLTGTLGSQPAKDFLSR